MPENINPENTDFEGTVSADGNPADGKSVDGEPADGMSLEEAFEKLEEILKKLSSKDVPLEEAFSLYEEGTKLVRYSSEKLDMVEKKMLVLNGEGGLDEF